MMFIKKTDTIRISIGIFALVVGVLVYIIDRPPDHTYFINAWGIKLCLHNIKPGTLGFIGNILPDFIHVFSFILLTGGTLSSGKKGSLIICLSWLFIDFTFELGQKYSDLFINTVPDWLSNIPALKICKNYFHLGTFDMFDMLAILAGTISAYIILIVTLNKSEP